MCRQSIYDAKNNETKVIPKKKFIYKGERERERERVKKQQYCILVKEVGRITSRRRSVEYILFFLLLYKNSDYMNEMNGIVTSIEGERERERERERSESTRERLKSRVELHFMGRLVQKGREE